MSEPVTLIEHIRRLPAMYFGSKSLSAFQQFHRGFEMACYLHKIEDHRLGLVIPDDFHDWVAYRTHFRESTSGWCNMIIATTASEEEAFDRFFELLDEHSRRIPRLVAKILRPISTAFRIEPDGDVLIPAPQKVRLVKYTDDPGFFALFDNPDWQDRFYPYLSWIWGVSGGELVIHDEESYCEMIRANEEREREVDREQQ